MSDKKDIEQAMNELGALVSTMRAQQIAGEDVSQSDIDATRDRTLFLAQKGLGVGGAELNPTPTSP